MNFQYNGSQFSNRPQQHQIQQLQQLQQLLQQPFIQQQLVKSGLTSVNNIWQLNNQNNNFNNLNLLSQQLLLLQQSLNNLQVNNLQLNLNNPVVLLKLVNLNLFNNINLNQLLINLSNLLNVNNLTVRNNRQKLQPFLCFYVPPAATAAGQHQQHQNPQHHHNNHRHSFHGYRNNMDYYRYPYEIIYRRVYYTHHVQLTSFVHVYCNVRYLLVCGKTDFSLL